MAAISSVNREPIETVVRNEYRHAYPDFIDKIINEFLPIAQVLEAQLGKATVGDIVCEDIKGNDMVLVTDGMLIDYAKTFYNTIITKNVIERRGTFDPFSPYGGPYGMPHPVEKLPGFRVVERIQHTEIKSVTKA